ncbi:sigma-54-dependent Fis family transcriptional regulator, partial [bacterium]|nr:sigma-54-dependent Fis family transcriptional regulator [bacterium]
KGDIPLLVDFFLKRYNVEMNKKIAGMDKDAEQALLRYHWPGNVRQLENCIERAIVLSKKTQIGVEDLPADLFGKKQSTNAVEENNLQVGMTVADMERQLIFKTLDFTNNNRTRAAEMLGISIRTLRNKLNEYKNLETMEPKTGTAD